MSKILAIIPSRYDSARLPGKPLLDIYGKSMIERVYRSACKANLLSHIVVATDDKRINDLGNEFFKFFNGGSNREKFSIRYDNFIKFHKDNNIGLQSQIFAY